MVVGRTSAAWEWFWGKWNRRFPRDWSVSKGCFLLEVFTGVSTTCRFVYITSNLQITNLISMTPMLYISDPLDLCACIPLPKLPAIRSTKRPGAVLALFPKELGQLLRAGGIHQTFVLCGARCVGRWHRSTRCLCVQLKIIGVHRSGNHILVIINQLILDCKVGLLFPGKIHEGNMASLLSSSRPSPSTVTATLTYNLIDLNSRYSNNCTTCCKQIITNRQIVPPAFPCKRTLSMFHPPSSVEPAPSSLFRMKRGKRSDRPFLLSTRPFAAICFGEMVMSSVR